MLSKTQRNNLSRVRFGVTGMHCVSCAFNVDFGLEDLEGVVEVETNFARGITEVVLDGRKINEKSLIETITQLGYMAVVDKEAHGR